MPENEPRPISGGVFFRLAKIALHIKLHINRCNHDSREYDFGVRDLNDRRVK